MKKQHDGKNGCGAKRFSGAHPFRRAFRMQSVMLFSFAVAPAVARAVLKARRRACACLPARQRRHLYQDKHTPCSHDQISSQSGPISSQFTLTFDCDVDIRAIMIYNAMDIRQAFYEVERIVFTCRENGTDTYRVIEHLGFDWRGLSNGYDADFSPTGNSLKTGGAAIAEFDTLTVREISITLKPATESQIDWHDSDAAVQLAIGEIVVLGKKQ